MRNLAQIIFLLNIIAYSPIFSYLESGSTIIRIIQIFTILCSIFLAPLPVINNKKTIIRLCSFLIAIFGFNLIAELFHSSVNATAIFRLLLHCIYIISIYIILTFIPTRFFYKSVLFLLLLYIGYFLLYIKQFNPDFSLLLSGNLESAISIKSEKREIVDSGFSLSTIHIYPLLLFILLPYTKKRIWTLCAIIVSICLLFSLTFTAILAFLLCLITYLTMRHYKLYSNRCFIYSFIAYVIILIFLYAHDFYDLRTLTTGRTYLWQLAIEEIKDNFLWGISLDDFYQIVGRTDSPEIEGGSCHNMYLSWLMNHGIISFIIYLSYINFLWKRVIQTQKDIRLLLPFIYILIRGTHEATGFIDFSDGIIEYIVDIYLMFTITNTPKLCKKISAS